jgi:hypothetical protein
MKQLVLVALVAFLIVGLLPPSAGYAQTRNVTFLVNSATVPDTAFAGYSMQIRGSKPPLTWGNDTGGQLINVGGDYWSKTLAFNVGDTVQFKIFAGTDGWEQNLSDPYGLGGGNRIYVIANRDTTLPLQFFNNGVSGRPQYFRPWTTVADTFINVYFRVNMQGADQVQRFSYRDSVDGDSVGVRGGGPGPDLNWAPTFYLTKEQPASNGGFSYAAKWFKSGRLRIRKNAVNAGDGIDFKFLIGFDWGRDELQGQPNRHFTIPIGKKDTTITWKWFDNIRPSGRINTDTVVVTYSTDLTKAITSGGFSIGDTVEVEQGHFGTISPSGTLKVKRLARQGLSNLYQVVDTVVTARNFVLDYQYYVNKNGVRTRESYYNFFYRGDVQAEAERRQVTVAGSGPMTVRDTSTSISQARRRPDFPNARRLLRNVLVKWEVDMRPAYYQILIGHDTLFDIQGTYSITTPGQVFQYGAYINGLATGGWQTWGSTLETDTTRKMWDDGTHGDRIANDSIYTRIVLASPDSLNIGSKSQVGQIFKFGIRGGDNEGGRGGFGNNHSENIVDATNSYTLASQWGSINPAYYHNWDFDNRRPIFTGVSEVPGIPVEFELSQNYPNPFNPVTKINYAVPTQSFVTLKVYNVIGQEVATLVNEMQKAAKYVATFDAKRLASGVYFYRLQAGGFVDTKKFVLLK